MSRRNALIQTNETSKHVLRHYDFSNMGFGRLLALQEHLSDLYKGHLKARRYSQARDALIMKEEVDDEIEEQSRAIDAFREQERSRQMFNGETSRQIDPETSKLIEEMKERHKEELKEFDASYHKTSDMPLTKSREHQDKMLMRRRLQRRQRDEMKAMVEKREMQQIAASWTTSRAEQSSPVFTTEVPRVAMTPDPRKCGPLYKEALARNRMRGRR